MRAMWKGSVAFGLVNVPIKLYAATEDHDVRFHQVHAADGGRVKMVRTCSIDGQPVDYKDLAKAYETESGQVVIMEEQDFEGLPVPGVREIEVLEFVPAEQVDPVLFDRSYYLEPEARALKPYVLLREALSQTDRMALVRVVLRQKSQLAALRVRGDVLVMQTMLWPDEVRAAEFDVLDADVELRPQELSMASSLIDSLSSDFDPEEFHDEYREALLGVIDNKLSGGDGVSAETIAASGDTGDGIVVDLMAALRESVERTQKKTRSRSRAKKAS
jgi:DNA end-binding protein Ku